MAWKLTRGTVPDGLEIKTIGFGPEQEVMIGSYDLPFKELLSAVHIVLTSTDLRGEDDQRLQFLKCVRAMEVVEGYLESFGVNKVPTVRLHSTVPPFIERSPEEYIEIGEYTLSMEDFWFMVHYVLTNTNLRAEGDPRVQFVKCVQSMRVLDDHLHTEEPPVLEKPPKPKRLKEK